MAPEDIKKIVIVVCSFLVIFLVFFFFFWRPQYSELKITQEKLSKKQAELIKLERDAEDWPESITRARLRRYEEELMQLWEKVPAKEEISDLLKEIQIHARNSELDILSLSRITVSRTANTPEDKETQYVRIPYKISVSGSYFGLVSFLRRLEDSRRLVTITSTRVYTGEGNDPVGAEVEFNVFYSKVGVAAG